MTRSTQVQSEEFMNQEYNFVQRMIHWFFSTKSLFSFIGYYILLNIFVIVPGLIFIYAFGLNMKIIEINAYSTLIGVQVGLLGVISIALALVTIIAPKNNETSIIEIYYHESRAFEIISSSFALLGVFSIQVFISIQSIAPLFVIENIIPLLSIIPFFWLMANFLGINHFIMTTLDFVNPSKRRKIRKRFTRHIVQSGKLKNSDLPDPNRILNELAIKAFSKIDQNNIFEFRIVWEEMTDYHRFLFSLFMEQKRKGGSIAFATDIDDKGKSFYTTWKEEYSQLFKRATDKMLDEKEFIRILADTPEYLLDGSDAANFSEEIIGEILGIMPILTKEMTKWACSKSSLNKLDEKYKDIKSKILLSPIEAKIYGLIIFRISFNWRKLFTVKINSLYWDDIDYSKLTNKNKWNNGKISWYFLWRHLCYTSHIMACAIADGDEEMALFFRKLSLFEYKKNIPEQWRNTSINMYFLPPDIIDKNWSDAEEQGKALSGSLSITPEDIYANMFTNAYQDILFMISGLILDWMINKRFLFEVDNEFIDNFLNKLKGKSYIHDLNLFFHMLRLITIEFHKDIKNQHYYLRDMHIIMRDANQSAFCFDNDVKHWEQIMEACVIIFAGNLSLGKYDLIEYTNELENENNRVITIFADCLTKMASKLKDPSRFVAVLANIGYEGDPDEALNALHGRINEIVIDLEGHS